MAKGSSTLTGTVYSAGAVPKLSTGSGVRRAAGLTPAITRGRAQSTKVVLMLLPLPASGVTRTACGSNTSHGEFVESSAVGSRKLVKSESASGLKSPANMLVESRRIASGAYPQLAMRALPPIVPSRARYASLVSWKSCAPSAPRRRRGSRRCTYW